jgi:hypothetical protein
LTVAPEDRSAAVQDALLDAQARGFLGPGPVEAAVAHARSFVDAVGDATSILDLGSGAGLPGLVVAAACPAARVTLLDASERRTDWLRRVVTRFGWDEQVQVVLDQAEVVGHDPRWRTSQAAVVARSFAPPLVTAECAAAFLTEGGRLVVSEPPAPDASRWPADDLDYLGLQTIPWPDRRVMVLVQVRPCPVDVPRPRLVRGRTS